MIENGPWCTRRRQDEQMEVTVQKEAPWRRAAGGSHAIFLPHVMTFPSIAVKKTAEDMGG